jgi:hypothetical protein
VNRVCAAANLTTNIPLRAIKSVKLFHMKIAKELEQNFEKSKANSNNSLTCTRTITYIHIYTSCGCCAFKKACSASIQLVHVTNYLCHDYLALDARS